ncbi:gamma carbonic anhydrase family protein [Methanolobus sp. ZRKC3]|uniref:gamma carbonic anhydrase family protein n=1 Tax=Methanolobus sp. ZRKC3 TaxID=3125786 RepID=UPI003243B4CF
MIIEFKGKGPQISEDAFVADSADVIGDVEIQRDSSVWYGAVIRGDVGQIKIGERTSIQDNAVIHTDPPLIVEIGNDVTVGHGAVLHGCSIGDNTLIGMNATVLDGAQIGKNCIVGANALIAPGKIFPDNSVITGVPGTVRRETTEQDIKDIKENAAVYVGLTKDHMALQKS